MKKALAILLALSMLLSLAACGESTAPASSGAGSEQVTEAAEDAAAAASAAVDQNLNAATSEPAAEAASSAVSEQNAASSETAAQAAADSDRSAEAISPVGTYKLTGQTGNSERDLSGVLNIVKMGGSLYLSLKEDGSGTMNLLEAEIPLEWDDSDIIIPPGEENDLTEPVRIPYTCEEESLKMNTPDYSLDFSRLTAQELAEYSEKGSGSLKGQLNRISQMLVSDVEEGLGDLLFFAMTQFGNDSIDHVPEGEPSEGPVTGTVNGISFTILGADQVQSDEGPLIAFYFEATNTTDEYREIWYYGFDAGQDGSYLEETWGLSDIPEEYNVNYGIAPGRTIRGASSYEYDPDGGVVAFVISSFEDKDNTVVYFADPRNLSGAPAEPFAFDNDPSVPEYVEALPEESAEILMESAEYFTDEDGDNAVRFYFTFRNTSETDEVPFYHNYTCYALQDGISLPVLMNSDSNEEELNYGEEIKPGQEILCASSYKLRTGSPVSFVVHKDNEESDVAAKTYEIE